MFNKNYILMLLCLAILAVGCKKELKPGEGAAAVVQPAQVYYTQFSLFQEQNKFRTTNYRKGQLIPINTPVALLSLNSDEAVLKLEASGQVITIENVPKFTKDEMPIAFSKIAGTSKVDLNQFTAAERESILAGQVKKDMSKKAVLAAIGYPPQHVTPSLDGDDWTYWSNLFNRFVVKFKNGKVDSIFE
jgi:hypothetical protein